MKLLENLLSTMALFATPDLQDQDTPDVENLFARIGTAEPHLCFAGHTDVVPVATRPTGSTNPLPLKSRRLLYGRAPRT